MTIVIIITVALIVGSSAVLAYSAYKKSRTPGASRRQLDLALVQLSQEIRRNPNGAVPYSKRGIIRQKKGDLAGAIEDFAHALALDPTLTEAHYHHGMALQEKGDLAGAEKEFAWIMSHSEDAFFKTAVSGRLAQVRAKRRLG